MTDSTVVQTWACRGDGCKGRMFGGWMNCIHGWRGRLAELDKEREALLDDIERAGR